MAQNNDSNNGNTGLTAEQLETLLTRVIAAVKAPNVVEQQQIDEQQRDFLARQEERKKASEGVLQERANKLLTQQLCSHEHPNGDTHCVYVMEKVGPGYIICQKNQCIIRPGQASPKYKGAVIYDTQLFNRLFQKANRSDIFG